MSLRGCLETAVVQLDLTELDPKPGKNPTLWKLTRARPRNWAAIVNDARRSIPKHRALGSEEFPLHNMAVSARADAIRGEKNLGWTTGVVGC